MAAEHSARLRRPISQSNKNRLGKYSAEQCRISSCFLRRADTSPIEAYACSGGIWRTIGSSPGFRRIVFLISRPSSCRKQSPGRGWSTTAV